MKTISYFFLIVGLLMLIINSYGLTKTLRPHSFEAEHLRFGANDITLALNEYQQLVQRQAQESNKEYSFRLTEVIAKGTAHIHWEQYAPEKFNQLVPVWENWLLYLMGKLSGIPEYERYHFVTPEKSIERGIGICGEVSMLMFSLLQREGISASILTYPGHVVVGAEIDGNKFVFDPDFGVVINGSPTDMISNPGLFEGQYLDAGYTVSDEAFFRNAYAQKPIEWDGPRHFITKKYYFEKISYWMKWVIPSLFIVFGFALCVYVRRNAVGKIAK